MRGEDSHARIELELIDAYKGAERGITLRGVRLNEQGQPISEERTLQVKIPKGVKEGQLIRLTGQGSPGFGGGATGDLFLEVHFRPDTRWRIEGPTGGDARCWRARPSRVPRRPALAPSHVSRPCVPTSQRR